MSDFPAPALSSDPRPDAIIIGAGIIGCSTALALSQAGYKTLNIERNAAPGLGSTSASTGAIRVHYSTFDGTALAYESYHHWLEWRDFLGAPASEDLAAFHHTGCLVPACSANAFLAPQLKYCDQLGIAYQPWSSVQIEAALGAPNLASFFPVRSPEDPDFGEPSDGRIEQAIFFETAGYVSDPQLACLNMAAAAQRAGGRFLFNAEVAAIRQEGGRVAGVGLTGGQQIDAPLVINVSGPHSSKINALAGVAAEMVIKTRALKQEKTVIPAPATMAGQRPGLIWSDSDVGVYFRSHGAEDILIGSQDFSVDPMVWVDDPDAWDENFSQQWQTQAWRLAQRLPALGIPSRMRGVVALYDVADDWIPIYDRSSLPGYYMACGTSGNQFKNAPMAGRLMAGLVQACEGGQDHDQTPVRLPLARIGQEANMGFYSRLRAINAQSSMSVVG
jgi:sarcosine oxidase subunit beta